MKNALYTLGLCIRTLTRKTNTEAAITLLCFASLLAIAGTFYTLSSHEADGTKTQEKLPQSGITLPKAPPEFFDAEIRARCPVVGDATPAVAQALANAAYLQEHTTPMSDAAGASTEGAHVAVTFAGDNVCYLVSGGVHLVIRGHIVMRNYVLDTSKAAYGNDAAIYVEGAK